MKIPSFDKDTMKGVLSLEGLYNGDYASAKAALAGESEERSDA